MQNIRLVSRLLLSFTLLAVQKAGESLLSRSNINGTKTVDKCCPHTLNLIGLFSVLQSDRKLGKGLETRVPEAGFKENHNSTQRRGQCSIEGDCTKDSRRQMYILTNQRILKK